MDADHPSLRWSIKLNKLGELRYFITILSIKK